MEMRQPTFVFIVSCFGLEERTLANYCVQSNPTRALHPQRELAGPASIDADDLGSNAKAKQIVLVCGARVDQVDTGALWVLATGDEELAVRADQRGRHGHTRYRDGVDAAIRAL